MKPRSLISEIGIYGVGDLVFRGVAVAIFPVYTHVFSVSDFGVMELASTAAAIVASVGNVGQNNAVQRYYWDPLVSAKERPVWVSTGLAVLSISCLIAVVCAIIVMYGVMRPLEDRFGLSWSIVVLAVIAVLPSQALQYSQDVLRLHFSAWSFTIVSFLRNGGSVLASLAFVVALGFGVKGVFLGTLLAAISVLPLAFWLIRSDLVARPDFGVARKLLNFGWPFIFVSLGYWVLGSLDRWMLAELSDLREVGIYAVAFKFATAVFFCNSAFGQAWSPVAMKLRTDFPETYRVQFSRVFSSWFFVLVILGGGIGLFSRELLALLTPDQYYSAAKPIALSSAGAVLFSLTQITAIGISIVGKSGVFANASWLAAGLNIGLNVLLIPSMGALGAALATLAAYGLMSAIYMIVSQRVHPIPIETGKLSYCLAGLISFVVVAVWSGEGEIDPGMVLGKCFAFILFVAGGLAAGLLPSSKTWTFRGES